MIWKLLRHRGGVCRISARAISTTVSPTRKAYDETKFASSSLAAIMGLCCATVLVVDGTLCDDSNDKIFRSDEIRKHNNKNDGIWVTFQDGVYDVTHFVDSHPGGIDKIMLAAGSAVEPYWRVYRQHYNSAQVKQLLAGMRIGTVHPDDIKSQKDEVRNLADPYGKDPSLLPIFEFLQNQPINAQPPSPLLTDSWVTPNDFWFVRNHHPVPVVDLDTYRLSIDFGDNKGLSLTVEELKNNYKQHSIVSTIQCGGNRRKEMNTIDITSGSPWDISAISTAKFTGVRLADVLRRPNITITEEQEDNMHVQFEGIDGLVTSIPLSKAMSSRGDVLLAYDMNDQPLSPEHGFPIRVVVPGHVGVRNVKWVHKVRIQPEEAQGTWQRGMAYKGFGPSRKSIEGIDTASIPSLQEVPVTSAVTHPQNNEKLESGYQIVQGYAYSGGGRGIVRVDVSSDGGQTWQDATLLDGSKQRLDRAWAWTFWEAIVDLPEVDKPTDVELICKATDASYNVQPDTLKGIWNLRGINNNAWHRIHITIMPSSEE